MQRVLLVLLTIFSVGIAMLFGHQHPSIAISRSDCIDIPANPDYLSSGSAQDAIAAINNAHQIERLPSLRLPANFYKLDPAQQQFILLNLERTDRKLHPLQWDANLSQMALAYSKQLRDLNFFSHTSMIGGTFSDRINSNPTIANHYSLAAENLAGNPVPGIGPIYEYMYDDTVENCGHRHNILDPSLTLIGIGWLPGSIYGSISAQEFITSATWNSYQVTTPDTLAPELSISVSDPGQNGMLPCQAFTHDNLGVVRITWFLDHIDKPVHTGSAWMLDTHHLSAGKHTLYVFAVDGEGNYTRASHILEI